MPKKLFLLVSMFAITCGTLITYLSPSALAVTCSDRENCPCESGDNPATSGCIPNSQYSNGEVVLPTDYPEKTPEETVENPDEPTSDGAEDSSFRLEDWFDAEKWPVYLSLGAIIVTFLLIVIINIIGRKKRH